MLSTKSSRSSAARGLRSSRPARVLATRVVAFRDVHRVERLCQAAHEYTTAYTQVLCGQECRKGTLEGISDNSIDFHAIHPMGSTHVKGVDALLEKLSENAKALKAMGVEEATAEKAITLIAAQDMSDVAFVLLSLPLHSAKAEGAPAGQDDKVTHTSVVLKLDFMLDDTVCGISAVTERAQHAGGPTTGDRIQQAKSLKQAQDVLGTAAAAFPVDLIKPWDSSVTDDKGIVTAGLEETVEGKLHLWCAARSSGTKVEELMAQAWGTAEGDDRAVLWDGYGVMPLLCARSPDSKEAQECHMNMNQMKDVLQATKEVYNVDCRVIDTAVCLDKAVAFTHWRAHLLNHITGTKTDVDAFEVDILDPVTGALRGVYLLRDAFECEDSIIKSALSSTVA